VGGTQRGLEARLSSGQRPFQEPKLEVPTIYKAYVREYHSKIWPYMVQYLHFRILKFPLIWVELQQGDGFRLFALTLSSEMPTWLCRHHVISVKPQISNFEPELSPQIDGAAAKEHSESIVEAKG